MTSDTSNNDNEPVTSGEFYNIYDVLASIPEGQRTADQQSKLDNLKKRFDNSSIHFPQNNKIEDSMASNPDKVSSKPNPVEQSTLDRILKLEVGIDASLKFVGAILSAIGIVIAFMSATLFFSLNSMKQDLNQIKQEVKQTLDTTSQAIDAKNNAALAKMDATLNEIKKDNEIAKKEDEIARAKEEQFKAEIKAILLEKK